MKKFILFFGSFDPLHNGHISIMENAIKKVNANLLYIGLNKSSKKGKLTSFFHRSNMIKSYIKNKGKYKLLNFSFDYNDLDKTYEKIFNLMTPNDKYYILIGQDQLNSLEKWHNYGLLRQKFDFIIAKRNDETINDKYLNDSKYIFIDHSYKNISSTLIKVGNYEYTNHIISNYIINNNLYLKNQIKPLLTIDRYKHTLLVAKTALLINKKGNLGLDKYKVEKAALLHDIAKNIDKKEAVKLLKEHYPGYINESSNIIHQYLGEYLAREKFYVHDEEILKAIKYHTTGRSHMSLLEKLIYVSDKIEPSRNYDTTKLVNSCIQNFDLGFKKVLKTNKEYMENKNISIDNVDTLNCFEYYLK